MSAKRPFAHYERRISLGDRHEAMPDAAPAEVSGAG